MVTTGASGVPLMGSLGRGSNTDIRIQTSEVRLQNTDIRNQKSDIRSQTSEVRRQDKVVVFLFFNCVVLNIISITANYLTSEF